MKLYIFNVCACSPYLLNCPSSLCAPGGCRRVRVPLREPALLCRCWRSTMSWFGGGDPAEKLQSALPPALPPAPLTQCLRSASLQYQGAARTPSADVFPSLMTSSPFGLRVSSSCAWCPCLLSLCLITVRLPLAVSCSLMFCFVCSGLKPLMRTGPGAARQQAVFASCAEEPEGVDCDAREGEEGAHASIRWRRCA